MRLKRCKSLNPFCLSVCSKLFCGALKDFSVLEKDEEVNVAKSN